MASSLAQYFTTHYKALLERLCGTESLPTEAEFWFDLVTLPWPLSRWAPTDVEEHISGYVKLLAAHSGRTRAFSKLLNHMAGQLSDVQTNVDNTRAVNSVILVRVLVKAAVEQLGGLESKALFEGSPEPLGVSVFSTPGRATKPNNPADNIESFNVHDVLRRAVRSLLTVVCGVPTAATTYLLKLEALQCLQVMMSTQLPDSSPSSPAGAHPFTEVLMQQESFAPAVVRTLLDLFVQSPAVPSACQLYRPAQEPDSPRSSKGILRRMGSAAGSVLSLPYRAASYVISSGPASRHSPIGEAALHCLLLLIYHFPSATLPPNPYRSALCVVADLRVSADPEDTKTYAGELPVEPVPATSTTSGSGSLVNILPGTSYAGLHATLSKNLQSHAAVLLLYTLLANNKAYAEYVLVCAEPTSLLLGLLEMLYSSTSTQAEGPALTPLAPAGSTYMLLICVLLLSQDPVFAAELHKGPQISSVPWYRERNITAITLGSLAFLVLLRAASHSLGKGQRQDVYIATNSLAALGNLAPHASGISSLAAQRMVAVYDLLRRRLVHLEQLQAAGSDPSAEELSVTRELLRIVLEVINTMLVQALPRNPEMAYSLLHRQELFAALKHHPWYGNLMTNITTVVDYFNARVEAERTKQGWEWSVDRVLEVIKHDLRTWRQDRLSPVSDLNFTYEEEASSQNFFVPYAWSTVVLGSHAGIPWNLGRVRVFAMPSAERDTMALAELEITNQSEELSNVRSPVRENQEPLADESV